MIEQREVLQNSKHAAAIQLAEVLDLEIAHEEWIRREELYPLLFTSRYALPTLHHNIQKTGLSRYR